MSTFDLVGALPLEVEGYDLEPLSGAVSSAFTRLTTVVRLHGAGETGLGEEVTWGEAEQLVFRQAPPALPPAGRYTLATWSEQLGELDLFATDPPSVPEWRLYRRWAFESAALDLALLQAGVSLGEAFGREPQPVRFVVSLRLGEPPSAEPVRRLLALHPGTRFKLDPTVDWGEALVEELVGTAAVDILDFKSAYRGAWGQQPADPGLYRRLAEAFPAAWIEDPNLRDPATLDALRSHRDRITWDAVVHSAADVDVLPFPPRMLNCKPSRFGSVRALFDFYDLCVERAIGLYGGGQFELGPGRGQIQLLASLFHPDAPNDVAPGGYNDPEPGPGLETSPLEPGPTQAGFGTLR